MCSAAARSPVIESISPFGIVYAAIVLVLSYGLRGTTGFGSAAAMPLMALAIPMKILVPTWTLMGIASSLTVLGKDRRHVAVRDVVRVLHACAVGVGIGLYLFTSLDPTHLRRGLGALVVAYGAYTLWGALRPQSHVTLPPRVAAPLGGLLAGAVGTMFGTMASLFFVMYLDATRMAKTQFRATMSALVMTLSVIRGAGYWAVGEFTREVLLLFAVGLPTMLLGIYLGDRVHAWISEAAFRRLVSLVLIVSGIPLLLK